GVKLLPFRVRHADTEEVLFRLARLFLRSRHSKTLYTQKSYFFKLLTCVVVFLCVQYKEAKLTQMLEQQMDMRELKALEIAARSRIIFENGAWLVPSQTTGEKYRV